MDKRKVYMINNATISLFAEFDEFGNENTRVIEGERMFLVARSPIEIIDQTLNYYGSSLEGAIEGTKSILGVEYCIPIVINPKEIIVLFSCGSFRRKDSIWIANKHVVYIERLGKETIVHTNCGHSLIVPMNISQVGIKMGQISRLLTTLIHRSKRIMYFLYERESGFILRKEIGELNMNVKDEGEES